MASVCLGGASVVELVELVVTEDIHLGPVLRAGNQYTATSSPARLAEPMETSLGALRAQGINRTVSTPVEAIARLYFDLSPLCLALFLSFSLVLFFFSLSLSLPSGLSRQNKRSACAKMVWFPSMGTDGQLTSFLESLTTMQHVSNESSVKVGMSVDLMDPFEFKGSETLLTLSWSKSRKTKVQRQGGMLDHARQQLSQLLEVYHGCCETGQVKLPPRGSERAASLLRRPPWSEYLRTKGSTGTANEPKPMYVSDNGEFGAATGQITHGRATLLVRWPDWKERFCSADGLGIWCPGCFPSEVARYT